MPKPSARAHLNPKPLKTKKVRLAFKTPRNVSPPRDGTKLAKILTLLRRPTGASLGELVHTTGWLEHSVRAALTRGSGQWGDLAPPRRLKMPKPPARVRLRPHGNSGKRRKTRIADVSSPAGLWPRRGSKLATMLTLLMRSEGVLMGELVHVTGWHEHSVRAALVGIDRRRMGLTVMSVKSPDHLRRYHVRKPGPLDLSLLGKEPVDE